MLRTYIRLAFRNLKKNKLSSFINILGLAVAIGCSIVVFIFAKVSVVRDDFHAHADRIFMVEHTVRDADGQVQAWASSPLPLARVALDDIPQVEEAVRITFRRGIVQVDENVFSERLQFVDPAFLEVLNYPIQRGEVQALRDPNTIIIGESVATRYFGQENPLGQSMLVRVGEGAPTPFIVGGVLARTPIHSSFSVSLLIPIAQQERLLGSDLTQWAEQADATFLQLRQPGDAEAATAQLQQYVAVQNAAEQQQRVEAFGLTNIRDISARSFEVRDSIAGGSHPAGTLALVLIGGFILLLACFNYVNIAIGAATRRLKEIGVRKVMGSTKGQLVRQFLVENLVVCLFALLGGMALAEWVLVPGLAEITDAPYRLTMSAFFGDPMLWGFFGGILLLTGVGAGLYPAFYIAAFQPVTIFKGKQRLGGRTRFTYALLSFQFVLSFITLAMGIVVAQNGAYQANRDWGYNQDQTLVLPMNSSEQYAPLMQDLRQHPGVVNIAGATHHIGLSSQQNTIGVRGETYPVTEFRVGSGYLETLQFGLKEGRFLADNRGTDGEQAILVNETLVARQGWQNPVGQQVLVEGEPVTVVGVLEDFHYVSFMTKIDPIMVRLADEADFRYLAIQAQAGQVNAVAQHMRTVWQVQVPDAPYRGFFQDQVFASFYRSNDALTIIFSVAGLFALLIACMGLFGVVALHIAKRMKELSIHKVLGATTGNILHLVNKPFFWVMGIALMLAGPTSYFMMDALLGAAYEYYIDLTPAPFVATGGVLLLTAVLTVGMLVYKAATANPIVALRDE